MHRADINDRESIERIYPRAVFAREANANMRAKASVLSGVQIASAPDGQGHFELTRASRHAGEDRSSAGAIFLCPFAQRSGHGADDPAAAAPPSGERPRDAYDAFIDEVIAKARGARFPEPTGRHDPRLRGLRQ
jgi:hypothetical protein